MDMGTHINFAYDYRQLTLPLQPSGVIALTLLKRYSVRGSGEWPDSDM